MTRLVNGSRPRSRFSSYLGDEEVIIEGFHYPAEPQTYWNPGTASSFDIDKIYSAKDPRKLDLWPSLSAKEQDRFTDLAQEYEPNE